MKKKIVIAALLLLAGIEASCGMDSFNEAKQRFPSIYKKLDKPVSFYCGCPLSVERNRLVLSLKECGYEARKQPKRAARVEWEHVMSAWEFGHQLQCWQKGGRKQCRQDERFERMEGDMHNLFPAIGEVNGDRSNFRYNDWGGKPYQYGQCPMVVDFKGKRAQPPKRSRGMIARAYFYMRDTYGISLSRQQTRLFEAWDKMFAPDENECLRNELILKVQGNDNRHITKKCRR